MVETNTSQQAKHLATVRQLLGQLHSTVRQVCKDLRVHRLLPGPLDCSPTLPSRLNRVCQRQAGTRRAHMQPQLLAGPSAHGAILARTLLLQGVGFREHLGKAGLLKRHQVLAIACCRGTRQSRVCFLCSRSAHHGEAHCRQSQRHSVRHVRSRIARACRLRYPLLSARPFCP